MGFYSDQSGILRRYKREATFWSEHLQNTSNSILKFANKYKKGKIAILGSGWLLDIPVFELNVLFNEVWLFDIRHPDSIVKKYEEEGIHFVSKDISGYALPLYDLCKGKRKISIDDINRLQPILNINLDDFDCVISCNILDQLDDLLIEYIRNNAIVNSDVEKSLRFNLQQLHVDMLPKDKTLIITDTLEFLVNKESIVSEKKVIFCNIDCLKKITEWVWKFDNSKMYRSKGNTWFRVTAFEK